MAFDYEISIKNRMFDINALMEFIHINNDVNAQVKLFSTLSSYIMSKKVNISEVITYNAIYDKICSLLSNCPPRKASVFLNFLSVLLYTSDEDSKPNRLVIYAKNMIRSSGCLATMCELFTNCMMNQEAWQSLCRCLAEACRNVEANQSYCTHLVPACVQRCSQSNIEVLLVLQSLLQNHERNVNLFIECNGLSLFRREILKHNNCLQLLNTLVQTSGQAIDLINKTDTYQYLVDFLRLHGPESQLGQWATIILYHMSRTKGTGVIPVSGQKISDKQNTDNYNPDLQNTVDTTGFFQNVVKEIMQGGLLTAQFQSKHKNCLFVQSHSNQNQLQPNEIWTQNTSVTLNNCNAQKNAKISNYLYKGKRNNGTRDLSFSFLHRENNRRYTQGSMSTCKTTNDFQKPFSNIVNIRKSSEFCEPASLAGNLSCRDTPELSSFAPKFVSTPKKTYNIEPNKSSMSYVKNSTCTSFSNSVRKLNRKQMIRRQKNLSKVASLSKCLEQTNSDKENKHRSMSGRFFTAVNESCTTLVKTIKNIFRSKHSLKGSKVKCLTPETSTKSCSYSFTNYMRERDAILKNENAKEFKDDFEDFSMEMSHSCSSCNNTVVLKQKLANDEYLKQTIRKLKLGINLYGCDFKKISKQLWPQQTYMTPVVLYNLYRKLIIK